MRFNVTEDDFLKSQPIEPGWHSTQIVGYEEKMSKAKIDPATGQQIPPSAYVELKFKIVNGKDTGKIVYNNFSEKAPGFVIPFFEALTGQKLDPKKPATIEFSREKLLGQNIDVEVVREMYKGKPQNKVNAFKPYSGPQPAKV